MVEANGSEIEEINKLNPDLIIAFKMRHENIYNLLSQIAPTVMAEGNYNFTINILRLPRTLMAFLVGIGIAAAVDALVTMIIVLHDLNLAFRYADHVVAVKNKGVFAQGKPDKVIDEQVIKEVFDLNWQIVSDPVFGPLCI